MRRIMRLPEALDRTGLSKSTLHRLESAGNFPSRIRLSKRTSGFYEDEVQEWIDNRERVQLSN